MPGRCVSYEKGSVLSMQDANALFPCAITGWHSWQAVAHDPEPFTALIRYIFEKEGLPYAPPVPCGKSTNAVFRAGGYVIKLFVPEEIGFNPARELALERFAFQTMRERRIPCPECAACGCVLARYNFYYLIMEAIEGETLRTLAPRWTSGEKRRFARRLREILDRFHQPVEHFEQLDFITQALENRNWDAFPEPFRRELRAHLTARRGAPEKLVYVHGDTKGGNILLDASGEIYLIDFADTLLAPVEYEWSLVMVGLFRFDADYMLGFFGDMGVEELIDICMRGLPIHDFGADNIRALLGDVSCITGFDALRAALTRCLCEKRALAASSAGSAQ